MLVRDEIQQRVEEVLRDGGHRVYTDLDEAARKGNTPCFAVLKHRDRTAMETMTAERHTLDVYVHCIGTSLQECDDLELIARPVLSAVQVGKGRQVTETAFGITVDGEDQFFSNRLTLQVIYMTPEGDPTTEL